MRKAAREMISEAEQMDRESLAELLEHVGRDLLRKAEQVRAGRVVGHTGIVQNQGQRIDALCARVATWAEAREMCAEDGGER